MKPTLRTFIFAWVFCPLDYAMHTMNYPIFNFSFEIQLPVERGKVALLKMNLTQSRLSIFNRQHSMQCQERPGQVFNKRRLISAAKIKSRLLWKVRISAVNLLQIMEGNPILSETDSCLKDRIVGECNIRKTNLGENEEHVECCCYRKAHAL